MFGVGLTIRPVTVVNSMSVLVYMCARSGVRIATKGWFMVP